MFLRALGHDVLTVQEAGNANQGMPDSDVLAFATSEKRAVLTQNRKDFFRLHRIAYSQIMGVLSLVQTIMLRIASANAIGMYWRTESML
ncbi:MAG TPA: DUF5615 family PIN-like protein [Leptolyngbyaceae cyanobacterium]